MAKLVKPEWVMELNDQLKRIGESSGKEREQFREKLSIYRLPAYIKDLNKKAYQPEVASFGPYHYDRQHLKPMEEHKHRALAQFLKRSNITYEVCVDSLAPVMQDLKDSYDSLDDAGQKDTDEFLRQMILDGCFMLEILRKSARVDDLHQAWNSSNKLSLDDYAINDPVFSSHGKLNTMPYIKRDMLMIENQLPMKLLYCLLAIHNHGWTHVEEEVHFLIHKFYFSTGVRVSSLGKCLHVLDWYRKSLLFEDHHMKHRRLHQKTYSSVHESNEEIIKSAMELKDAGIQFRKSKTASLKDISFHRGVLRLPRVVVDEATESMFLNIIAFERFHVGAGNEVTSYISFMAKIIHNEEDVKLLNSRGIIQNAIGSDKAVLKLFDLVSRDITLEPHNNLHIVLNNVNNYYKKPWKQLRASLVHTYFRNHWAFLSVSAAILLFVLTIIQTIYTVLSYYKSG